MNRILRCAAGAVCFLAGGLVLGQQAESPASTPGTVPHLVSYSGVMKDAVGRPRSGALALTFSLYDQQDSNTPLWQEKQNVEADERGHYDVSLGLATANGIPLELFTSGRSLWLGVRQQSSAEIEQPRVLLVSAPYALKAADADTLGGKPASAFVTHDVLDGAATAAPSMSTRAITTAATIGGSGTAGYVPLWTPDGATLGNSLIYESGSNLGIGTTAPAGRLQLLAPTASTRGLIVQGAASQTANLQEWRNSSGMALGYVNGAGGASFASAGIGNIGPQSNSILYVRQAFGNPASNVTGVTVAPSMAPTAATSAFLYGLNASSTLSGSVGTSGQMYGLYGQGNTTVTAGGTVSTLMGGRLLAYNSGTGAVTGLFGGGFYAYNQGGGTVGSQYAGYFANTVTANSKVTNLYGSYIAGPSIVNGGSVTTAYGLYLQNVSGAGKNYSIYSAGGTSYFAGNVGIGTATPGANLEVNGTAKFDGIVTFAPGQTFPGGGGGGGTITGVTAGTDLTGGGTSGNVTLNLDTSKVPELAARNTFTNWQNIYPATPGLPGLTVQSAPTSGYTDGDDGIDIFAGSSPGGNGGIGLFVRGGNGGSDGSSGDGIDAYGGNGGYYGGIGIHAIAGGGSTGMNAAGQFDGYVVIHSDSGSGNPQLVLNQTTQTNDVGVSFQVSGGAQYWNIASNQTYFNLLRSDVQQGPVMSLIPGNSSGILLMYNGAYLSLGGAWTNASDRNLKTGFRQVAGSDVLKRLSAVPITTWSYKSEGESVRHMGPMAQDFAAAFQLGVDDKHITTIDEGGVALAAIQELYRHEQELDRRNEELWQQNQQMKAELAALKAGIHRRRAGRRPAVSNRRSRNSGAAGRAQVRYTDPINNRRGG